MNRLLFHRAASHIPVGGFARTVVGTSCLSRRHPVCVLPIQCQRWMSGGDVKDIDPTKFTKEIKIRMPEMGLGDGKIIVWHKKKGDIIRQDDVMCEIENKNFSFGMSADDECDAIMAEILVEAGPDPVKDGTVICTILHPEDESEDDKPTQE